MDKNMEIPFTYNSDDMKRRTIWAYFHTSCVIVYDLTSSGVH